MPAQTITSLLPRTLLCLACSLMCIAKVQAVQGTAPVLSKLDSNGALLPHDSQEWECVKDSRTGLVWEKKDPSSDLHGQDTFVWYQPEQASLGRITGEPRANPDVFGLDNTCFGYRVNEPSSYCNTSAFTDRINQSNYCGFSDWRLPSAHELLSLVDPQLSGYVYLPAIDTDYFPYTRRFAYWTSTVNAQGAVIGIFGDEKPLDNLERSDYLSVRLVRGTPLEP